MRIRRLHSFDLSPGEALRLQQDLRSRVRPRPLPRRLRLVAGADCALLPDGRGIAAVAVVLSLPRLEVVDRAEAVAPLAFPYVPGLLSFREGPALLGALERLTVVPDAVLFDGQGLAHPRRCGLACHLGLFLDLPTAGCAKSRLTGTAGGPLGRRRGCRRALRDAGEVVGWALRTRDGVREVYASPGHLCDLAGAARLVLATGAGYRLPEPTRLADRAVNRLSRHPAG